MADTVEIPLYQPQYMERYVSYRDMVSDKPNRWLLPQSLEIVNDIRAALAIGEGKLPHLPKGKKGDAKYCVIARALSNGWEANVGAISISLAHPRDGSVESRAVVKALKALGFEYVWATPSRSRIAVRFATPLILEELIDRFDAGKVPSLILGSDKPKS